MKSEFRTDLDMRQVNGWANNGRGLWELLFELVYYSALLGYEVTVPKSFRFDGSSVPRLPLAFALYGGRYWRAACIHDYLCRMGYIRRSLIDKVFLEAMRAENLLELAAMEADGADPDELAQRAAELEGQALTMYAGVAAYTKSGLWKKDVHKPGFEPVA